MMIAERLVTRKHRGKNAIGRYLKEKVEHAQKYSLPEGFVQRLDLNKLEKVQSLPTGTSGNEAHDISAGRERFVGKTNKKNPEVTAKETRAHLDLIQNPHIGPHLLEYVLSNKTEGILLLKFAPGRDLKTSQKKAETEEQEKKTRRGFEKGTKIFEDFWFSQEVRDDNQEIQKTMLVREWPDTNSCIDICTQEMSENFLGKTDENPLYSYRLLINEELHPSIREIHAMGNIYLKVVPRYVISGHRDAHAGNIILNPDTEQVKILDTGDAGDTPYGPEISKFTKILTPSTMNDCNVKECSLVEIETERGKEKVVKIAVNAKFSQTVLTINEYIKEKMESFSEMAQERMAMATGRNDYNLKKTVLLSHSLGRLNEVTYGFLTRFKSNMEMANKAGLWSVAQAAIEYKAYKDMIMQEKTGRRIIN